MLMVDFKEGVSQEDLPKIFDRFYRVEKSRSQEVEGYGLGLAIAERAALANSFKLEISCSDTEFKAVVKL